MHTKRIIRSITNDATAVTTDTPTCKHATPSRDQTNCREESKAMTTAILPIMAAGWLGIGRKLQKF